MPTFKPLLASLSCLLSACSPVNTLNALVPETGYTRVSDIAYGSAHRQRLDVYIPTASRDQAPAVIFYYGGSWQSGDKKDYKFVAEALASQGIFVVIPDYRVYPEVVFPDFVADAAAVVDWSHHQLSRYGYQSEDLFVMGHSAGAYLAAMLTLDKTYLQAHGLSPQILSGMIGLAGPYDFLPLKDDTLKTIFGPESQRDQTQPINFVAGDNPPMLLMAGKNDVTVWPRNSLRLAEKVRRNGGPVQLDLVPGYGHVLLAAALARPLRGQGRVINPVLAFIRDNGVSE